MSKLKLSLRMTKPLILLFLLMLTTKPLRGQVYYEGIEFQPGSSNTIGFVIPPAGYGRHFPEPDSFAWWLNILKLKPKGSPVYIYPVSNGVLKNRQDVHFAVVDLDVMVYQQCADAIIRLRAEYLWSIGRADDICFNFTSGDTSCWKKWKMGWRPKTINNGKKVIWSLSAEPDDSRQQFMSYLDKIMYFAGTESLSRELVKIQKDELDIGDVIIEGGFPGHAILIVDKANNSAGDKLFLLAQSFMPSQEFHILKNFQSVHSPWYDLKNTNELVTPEWTFDLEKDCRRFPKMDIVTEGKNNEMISQFNHDQKTPWIFPDSGKQLIDENELIALSKDGLWHARNEIYARHGYIFKSIRGKEYVESLGLYYTPQENDQNKLYQNMNRYEKENIKLILKYENK